MGFAATVALGSTWAGSGLRRGAGRARTLAGGTIHLWEVCEHGCVVMLGTQALLLSTGRASSAKRELPSLVASVWAQPWWFQARPLVPKPAGPQPVRWICSPGENLVSSAKQIMLKHGPLAVSQAGDAEGSASCGRMSCGVQAAGSDISFPCWRLSRGRAPPLHRALGMFQGLVRKCPTTKALGGAGPASICERLFEVSAEAGASLRCGMELLISLCGCRKGSALILLLGHLILQVNIFWLVISLMQMKEEPENQCTKH